MYTLRFHLFKSWVLILTSALLFLSLATPVDASGFGILTPGTNTYPSDGLQKIGKMSFGGASKFVSSAKDEVGGFTYMATGTSPATIVKIRTSDFQQVGSLGLRSGEGYVFSLRIDPTNDVGYAGLNIAPGKVIKFRLSTMERISSLTFNTGDDDINWGQIDTIHGYAYYSVSTTPARIVKVNLSTFTVDSVLTLNPGETNAGSAVIDDTENMLYIGLEVDKIVKVDLTTFTRVDALSTPAGEGFFSNGTIETSHDYIYIGTNNSPSRIYKVRIRGSFAIEEVFVMNSGETGLPSLFWNQNNSSLYAVISTNPAKVVQVTVAGVGPTTMVRGSTLTLNTGEDRGYAGQIDPSGNIFIGTYLAPAEIIKVQTSPTLARVNAISLTPSQADVHDAVMEPDGSIGYFLVSDQPGVVSKVDLKTMTWLGAIILPLDNSGSPHQPDVATNALLLDPIHHKLYVSVDSWTANDYLEQIDTTTFTIENRIVLANGGMDAGRAVMDAAGNYGYFSSCNSSNPKIFKLDINPASGTYRQVVATSPNLDVTSGCLRTIALDETDGPGYIYAGRESSTGKIYKVRLDTMASLGVLTLTGFGQIKSLTVDTATHTLYGGDNGNPGKVFKINLGTFTLSSSLTLLSGESEVMGVALDIPHNFLYAATYDGPSGSGGAVVRINPNTMTRLASSQLPGADWAFFRALFDIPNGVVYLADDVSSSVTLTKVSLSQKGRFFLTKGTLTELADTVNSLNFYSHLPSGDLRLGLYSLAGQLLWESPNLTNTTTTNWIRAAIKDGTPSTLSLSAGDYYFGFQTNTDSAVASYSLGASGTGQFSVVPYGPFPTDTNQLTLTSSTDNFSIHAIYNADILVTETGGNTTITEGGADDTYTITLKSPPVADVTVQLATTSAVSISSSTLVFTPLTWNTPQTIHVSHIMDSIVQGNRDESITYTITSSDLDYAEIALAPTTVSIIDKNAPTTPDQLFSASTTSTAQTGTASPVTFSANEVPVFSALFHDPDTGATANKYRLQIATDATFTTIIYDSGAPGGIPLPSPQAVLLSAPVNAGQRSVDIPVLGFSHVDDVQYYWKVKFFDTTDMEGEYSLPAQFMYTQPPVQAVPPASGTIGKNDNIMRTIGEVMSELALKQGASVTTNKTEAATQKSSAPAQEPSQSTFYKDVCLTMNTGKTECAPIPINFARFIATCTQDNNIIPTINYAEKLEPVLQEAILGLAKEGIIFEPRVDGTFGENSFVTRSEILRYVIYRDCIPVHLFQYPKKELPFPDVPLTHKDYFFVSIFKLGNIIQGYKHDGLYRPDQNATRAEAIKVAINRAAYPNTSGIQLESTQLPYNDVQNSDWFAPFVQHGVVKGITKETSKFFRPNDGVTRKELLLFLARSFQVIK